MPKAALMIVITVVFIINIVFSFVLNHAHLLKKIRSRDNILNRNRALFLTNYIIYAVVIFSITMLAIFVEDDALSLGSIIDSVFWLMMFVLLIGSVLLAYYLKKYLYFYDKERADFSEIKQFFAAYLSGLLKFLIFLLVPLIIIMLATNHYSKLVEYITDKDGVLTSYFICFVGIFFATSAKPHNENDTGERYFRTMLNLICTAIICIIVLLYISTMILIEMSVDRLNIPTTIIVAGAMLFVIIILLIDHSSARKAYQNYLLNPPEPEDAPPEIDVDFVKIEKGYLKRSFDGKVAIQAEAVTDNEKIESADSKGENSTKDEEKSVESKGEDTTKDEEKSVDSKEKDTTKDEEKSVDSKEKNTTKDEEKSTDSKGEDTTKDEEKSADSKGKGSTSQKRVRKTKAGSSND